MSGLHCKYVCVVCMTVWIFACMDCMRACTTADRIARDPNALIAGKGSERVCSFPQACCVMARERASEVVNGCVSFCVCCVWATRRGRSIKSVGAGTLEVGHWSVCRLSSHRHSCSRRPFGLARLSDWGESVALLEPGRARAFRSWGGGVRAHAWGRWGARAFRSWGVGGRSSVGPSIRAHARGQLGRERCALGAVGRARALRSWSSGVGFRREQGHEGSPPIELDVLMS